MTIALRRCQFSHAFVMCSCLLLALCSTSCRKQAPLDKQKTVRLLTLRNLGLAYLEESNFKEAEKAFLELMALAPEEPLGYANLSLAHLRNGAYDKAEAQIKKALALSPHNPDLVLILAEIYQMSGKENEAIAALAQHSKHVRSLYKIVQLYSRQPELEARWQKMEEPLAQMVTYLPANLPARLTYIEALLHNNKPGEALHHMETLRKQLPELSGDIEVFFVTALTAMQASQAREALSPATIFHNLLKPSPLYAAGVRELNGPGGALSGFPLVHFSQNLSAQMQREKTVLAAMRFTEVGSTSGLNFARRALQQRAAQAFDGNLALGDYDGDGDVDLFVTNWSDASRLLRNDQGRFVEVGAEAGIKISDKSTAATFVDYDNDADLDLYVVNAGPDVLYQNQGAGKFLNVAERVGIADTILGFASIFADLDHDGDLDLFLAGATANRLYRNNADGTFTEQAEKMGLEGEGERSRDAAIGDFDEDGDLDLFVVNQKGSNRLYTNLRQGQFQDLTTASGLQNESGAVVVATGDYDNNGFLDLCSLTPSGGVHLYRNKEDGTFEEDGRSPAMQEALQKIQGSDAAFFDFDNDGFLDLLLVGSNADRVAGSRGVLLFRNEGNGQFSAASSLLPENVLSARKSGIADYDNDGDLDIFLLREDGAVHLLRNDGGNANHWLSVKLVGLTAGSSKNNRNGIGARLEVMAGDLYQMRIVTEPISHFGLGARANAEVMRAMWSNGTPQNWFDLASNQTVVENQILKGSCPFLYTWDGSRYTFVTDVAWKSAIGMPLGIMAGEMQYAFPNSMDEYLKIPGSFLKAKDGKYSLQITEELWETAYLDQVKLIAVDHPDSVEIYVDEKFVTPPFAPLRIYTAAHPRIPISARDESGSDLLPLLREQDEAYVANLRPNKYQGLTQTHDLILDLGDLKTTERVTLFLNGWIFPTDASINAALSQTNNLKVIAPYLQVIDRNGHWQTVIENLSFPMGKNKIVIADLTGKFLTEDYRVRIRTNMEIYWNHVFFSTEQDSTPLRQTTLAPISAHLHYRGFSRMYRKSQYGPHWFDYSEVTTAPKWRDLIGDYTRYGDITSLLLASDDKYAICNSGDEITLSFDSQQPTKLAPGWSRDFLLYTDGWLKDGDLNTAHGKTVEPLPFHGMSQYPYGAEESYPRDQDHQEYLKAFNTRKVTSSAIKNLNP